MSLSGRRIALLGGTSGIGLAAARLALQADATPIAVGRAPERVAAVQRELAGVQAVALDVADEQALRAFFDDAGVVDHVFVTVGAPHYALLAELDLDEAGRAIADGVTTMLSVARCATEHVDPRGSVTFMGGTGARRPSPGLTVTGGAVGAAEALIRGLAVELAPIRVNAVAPGVVRSDLWREMSEEDRSAMYDSLSEALPVGRVGEVGDIAETFLYLMRNGYSSGTIVTVDGGSVLV
jgi:NAD(P)-dependent dehydrogenase (short-subunit alcohol dehydrogenase family)